MPPKRASPTTPWAQTPPKSEVKKKGVGGRGLATSSAQKYSKNIDRIGKKVQKRGLNLWHRKDFLVPTPSVRQPLFETSDQNPPQESISGRFFQGGRSSVRLQCGGGTVRAVPVLVVAVSLGKGSFCV